MALAARSIALRGEALFLVEDRLVPAADWDVSTKGGEPRAYRISISEAGGGTVAGDHRRVWCRTAEIRLLA